MNEIVNYSSEPNIFSEAKKSKVLSDLMDAEFASLQKNKTRKLV
jgi:hypothetical protein